MKPKKFNLFMMLTVLIGHTVLLSMWLADSEPVQKHAEFNDGVRIEKLNTRTSNFKVTLSATKDTIDVLSKF